MLDREENRSTKEFGESKEMNREPKEFKEQKEMISIGEMKENTEFTAPKAKALSKAKKSPRMAQEAVTASAVIGIASFAVIATSGLVNVTMNGSINEISYVDNQLCYNITVEDVEKDNSIFFEILDGSKVLMSYTIEFEHEDTYNGDLTGSFDLAELDLYERMKDGGTQSFDVHLCGDTGLVNRTYDSWILEIEGLKTSFSTEIVHGCDCKVSGNYLFTLDFQNDKGEITDIQASITDSAGTVRYCEFTSNYHEQQAIFVSDLAGGDCILTIYYKINGEQKTIVIPGKI